MIRYTYDFELQTMTTMFMNSMSDIVVKRFNVHKQPRDQIKTRIVYAPKQRVLNDLLNKDQNLQLPVISVYIGGVARDEQRAFNKILGSFHTPANSTSSINEKGPLPVDITYNVSIMTRYQQDMDQILSHLLPYVNPYFVISWRTPNRPDHEIRSNVFWSGNANIQYPVELNSNQVARVIAELSFTFKGWLFQNQERVENIFTFNTAFVNNIVGIPSEFLLDSMVTETAVIENTQDAVDHVVVQAAPPQPKVIEPYTTQVGVIQQFNVWGAGFENISNVYLSGVPLDSISTQQDPFALNTSLSAVYPSFFAVKLLSSEWAYDRDVLMTFVMPSANTPGKVDVIIENAGGYGKLTEHVRYSTFNPFVSTSAQYATFVPYQVPYLSGIDVIGPALKVGRYFYAADSLNDRDKWWNLNSWWYNSIQSIPAMSLANSTVSVQIIEGSVAPYVDLDREDWVQPLSIKTASTGINFYSNLSASVTCSITGSASFFGNAVFGAP